MYLITTSYEPVAQHNKQLFNKVYVIETITYNEIFSINSDIVVVADPEIYFKSTHIDIKTLKNGIYKCDIDNYSYIVFKGIKDLSSTTRIEKINNLFETYIYYKYKIYVNAFWNGFVDNNDINTIEFFKTIFKNTIIKNFTIVSSPDQANVLFESLFGNSLVNYKKWDLKIHYSGESRSRNTNDYDLMIDSELSSNKFVDIPLAIYYLFNTNLKYSLWKRTRLDKIPTNFCCFIVYNGNCEIRNKMFYLLNKYKPVHSCGKFMNNIGFNLNVNYWDPEYISFLSRFKFIICFENDKKGTYITEKIVNAYLAKIVPIYWGSEHIQNLFNLNSMIYLENESDEAFSKAIHKIIELDMDDEKYLNFINQPILSSSNFKYWNENYSINNISNKVNSIISNVINKQK